jgi:hypothetical protein
MTQSSSIEGTNRRDRRLETEKYDSTLTHQTSSSSSFWFIEMINKASDKI